MNISIAILNNYLLNTKIMINKIKRMLNLYKYLINCILIQIKIPFIIMEIEKTKYVGNGKKTLSLQIKKKSQLLNI